MSPVDLVVQGFSSRKRVSEASTKVDLAYVNP